MKNIKSRSLVFISILFLATGCTSYPKSLENNFQLARKNSSELKTVIPHYSTHRVDLFKQWLLPPDTIVRQRE